MTKSKKSKKSKKTAKTTAKLESIQEDKEAVLARKPVKRKGKTTLKSIPEIKSVKLGIPKRLKSNVKPAPTNTSSTTAKKAPPKAAMKAGRWDANDTRSMATRSTPQATVSSGFVGEDSKPAAKNKSDKVPGKPARRGSIDKDAKPMAKAPVKPVRRASIGDTATPMDTGSSQQAPIPPTRKRSINNDSKSTATTKSDKAAIPPARKKSESNISQPRVTRSTAQAAASMEDLAPGFTTARNERLKRRNSTLVNPSRSVKSKKDTTKPKRKSM